MNNAANVSSVVSHPSSFAFRVASLVLISATVLLLGIYFVGLSVAPTLIANKTAVPLPNITWTPEAINAALVQLGWSNQNYWWFRYLLQVLQGLPFVLLAVILLWRRSNTWMGLLVAFVIALNSLTLVEFLRDPFPWVGVLYDLSGNLGWQLFFILFYIFPDGRFVPRWTRWLLLGWLAINLVPTTTSVNLLVILLSMLLVFSALGSEIYRYFRVADTVQRQQTKWVLFAVIVILFYLPIAMLPFLVPSLFLGNGGAGLLMTMSIQMMNGVMFSLFPIAVVIAIFRYHLWDIDLIIRRTLIYGVLTALLAIVYVGSVVALQQLLRALTGQGSDLAIILSTLAIFILFGPLRNRVQRVIDRRFYRRKYDAQKILAAFSATARDEVDLGRLTDELQSVVEDTMQPEYVSLWLKRTQDVKRDISRQR